jgi:two-component system NtrC family sensor kinase
MSAVGNLISGIAHELNNPLAAVVGFSELLCMAEKPPKTLKEDLDNIRKNAMRCRAIVSTLLNFVRQRRVSRTLCRINDIVDATQDIMRYKLEKTESIILKKDLAPDLPPVLADPQQIGQVLVNLISNACDATSSNSGPREITITSALSGGKVRVVVRDNGCGISPQNRGKVFQPLFTTKNEKGTGLGLVICKSIMEEHGGRLSLLYSGPGTGTAFELLMEAATEAPEQEQSDEPEQVSGKRVLIIDDEEDLLPVMYRMIKGDGNSVDVASGGAEGIRKMAAGEYDLVISDVEMGALSGQAVYEAASKMSCPPCFLFVTGDVLNPSLADWAQVNRLVCLPKPFTMSEFRNTVRRLLAIPRG